MKYLLTRKFNKFSVAKIPVDAKDRKDLEKKIEQNPNLKRHKETWTIKEKIYER